MKGRMVGLDDLIGKGDIGADEKVDVWIVGHLCHR